ncbi:peptide-methionine (S)-S-oxide reductase [Flavobacterium magnum]|uniref:Peptide methionine sulfoxide reductase MsrA n=1 Tax=Flavobacterium magnum TaxID=2162713 RepID=A0A2S0REU9_9FLAO|nr:peptide-methionine (S)-S-oxide reductase MsrA [Flavobacterium magnum]AWA30467.1 peptide-methionine (S)-S-oxide reductase [Flavobacterium magnum]
MKKVSVLILAFFGIACQSKAKENKAVTAQTNQPIKMNTQDGMEVATFAGGCFWCTEAIFLELDGVKSVVSGYTGGARPNPTYEQVSSGATGHAEATEITFDPAKISFGELLEVFFATHDPTTLNRQGNDIGTQYRSEIFYHSNAQKQTAEDYIAQLTAAKTYSNPIVTKVSPAVAFYPAENYHQNYYNQNKGQSYCHYVITPKVKKVREHFKDKLKK